MLKMQADEELAGLAQGFAFRMVEGFGVITRGEVADEVKALEQDARGALRKHGVRFGQFTIFMPLLLKPAPTRLRLVLWSLSRGLQDFPEAPPPGLVTVPTISGLPDGTYTMSGYRAAGDRAIRIDMLERLADLLRDQNTRAGFEATADMLSITGMTLDQFANLIEGLGYKAEKGEREKVKAPVVVEPAPEGETPNPVPEGESIAPVETAEVEMELFYTITWAPKRSPRPQSDRPQRKGPPKGKKGGKPQRDNKAKNFSARPPKREKAIDPDNPFAAALAGLKKD
jgi:ATP-dependent RNA helicase SUPV3L1/SUV3